MKIFVTPCADKPETEGAQPVLRRVRHENGQRLANEGENVERTSWWIRRERDGDVTIGPERPEPVAEPAPQEPEGAGGTASTEDAGKGRSKRAQQ